MNSYYNNLVSYLLGGGGQLSILYTPDVISSRFPSICNTSILNDDGKLKVNLRSVNFIQHFENNPKISQCYYGSLCYLTPDDDNYLRSVNYYAELTDDLELHNLTRLELDHHEPQFEMVGVEDIRLVRWEGKLYGIGCNRDRDPSGESRMVMIELDELTHQEVSRIYIDSPENHPVEKNWVPILDKPFHFLRWFNPLQLVKVDPNDGSVEIVLEKSYTINDIDYQDHRLRGSSQIIPIDDNYLGIIHVVDIKLSSRGDKICRYLHQFILWDREFNLLDYSKLFNFTGNESEFCVGLCECDDHLYIPFSVNDGIQYLLKSPKQNVLKFIKGEIIPVTKTAENCDNFHEAVYLDSTWNSYLNYGLEFFSKQYYSAAYINFCRAYRELYYVDSIDKVQDRYNLQLLKALSIGYCGDRLLDELYELNSAVEIDDSMPEAYYYLSNYYVWRGLPQLARLYIKLAKDRLQNRRDGVFKQLLPDQVINLAYVKSFWHTTDFDQELRLLHELRLDESYSRWYSEIDAEIQRILTQLNRNNITQLTFGK